MSHLVWSGMDSHGTLRTQRRLTANLRSDGYNTPRVRSNFFQTYFPFLYQKFLDPYLILYSLNSYHRFLLFPKILNENPFVRRSKRSPQ